MASTYDQVLEIVRRYLTGAASASVVRQAVTECGKTPETFAPADVHVVLPRIERGVTLLLDVSRRAQLRADLEKLGGRPSAVAVTLPKVERVEIKTERDISDARLLSRKLCLDLQAKSLALQKVATVVSELARNIVSYTQGGYLELITETNGPKTIVIRAVDRGPGIPNLDVILSGAYRSKTGLGLGILGTKRLADRFDIKSDARGTRVEVWVRL